MTFHIRYTYSKPFKQTYRIMNIHDTGEVDFKEEQVENKKTTIIDLPKTEISRMQDLLAGLEVEKLRSSYSDTKAKDAAKLCLTITTDKHLVGIEMTPPIKNVPDVLQVIWKIVQDLERKCLKTMK